MPSFPLSNKLGGLGVVTVGPWKAFPFIRPPIKMEFCPALRLNSESFFLVYCGHTLAAPRGRSLGPIHLLTAIVAWKVIHRASSQGLTNCSLQLRLTGRMRDIRIHLADNCRLTFLSCTFQFRRNLRQGPLPLNSVVESTNSESSWGAGMGIRMRLSNSLS